MQGAQSIDLEAALDRPDELFHVSLALLENVKQFLRAFA